MAQESLKHKAASGMLWTAVQKYSTMVIGFVSSIILARLLSPDDYGCIGMLAIFIALADAIIDGGFGSALIQKKKPTHTDYSTIFYFNMAVSLLMYALLFFSAPAISRFYHMPILCPVLRVQGSILVINAFSLIQRNIIRKNLLFKKLAIITIITSIVSLTVTIVMAYKGCGVWSLVIQNIITALIPAVFFWISSEWHPAKEYSGNSFKELFGFGFFMFLSHLFETISSKISGLLIGHFYNSATMGYYSKASSTENLASSAISGIMIQTTYPLYAQVQDDKATLINMIKRITMTLSYITTPLMMLLIVVAKPIFVLLYSEKWLSSVFYFQVLCVAGMASCLIAVTNQPISAIGKSKVQFVATVIKRSIAITVQILGLILWGMKGLLIGVVFEAWFSYIFNACLISKYIGYGVFSQFKDLAPVLIVSLTAAVLAFWFGHMLNLGLYSGGIVKVVVFVLIYGGWSVEFKPESFRYSLSIVVDLLKRKKK